VTAAARRWRGPGIPLAKQYRDNGVDVLHEHAQFEDGSVSVEAGLMDMLDRMRGERFKVFADVSNDWWEEFRPRPHRRLDCKGLKLSRRRLPHGLVCDHPHFRRCG
jgi:hypothetical protein